ncbi:MAG: LysM peptidoglycan-binding domain-containing protein [Desulfobacterales bacterium]|nr:LysM peptidoglycan-binding domain-containing protein [Desulfobacterales bacterium]
MASSRTFLFVNVALVTLIGGVIWFLSIKGQTTFINLPLSGPAKVTAKPQAIAPSPAPAFSTEGLSADDIKAIEALQAQLEEEKKRAEKARANIQARDQAPSATQTPQAEPPVTPDSAGLRAEQQKQRIAQMIEARRQFLADAKHLDSLMPMEKERLNKTRWVSVQNGDTLYDIADLVYNDGWLYHKLFEANPQVLSNPGQRLRVPL